MFNVGGPEIVVIILVALLVLGPEQLPKAMRTFGNVMTQVRKVSGGFQAELKSVMDSVTDGIDPTKPAKASAPSSSADKPHSAPAGKAGVEQAPVVEPEPVVVPEPGVEPTPVAVDVERPDRELVDRAAG